jgi:hypothetical protein
MPQAPPADMGMYQPPQMQQQQQQMPQYPDYNMPSQPPGYGYQACQMPELGTVLRLGGEGV